jgi:type I restriction enzyme R subunit
LAQGNAAKVAQEIVSHFEKRREVIEGKGIVVCMSRVICMDLYDAIVALRPEWDAEDDDAGFVKVVMTGSSSEGERCGTAC